MDLIKTIGSFNIYEKELQHRKLFIVEYKPQHVPLHNWQFLVLDDAVVFANKKTKIDKKLF